jgi:hypothetical protein
MTRVTYKTRRESCSWRVRPGRTAVHVQVLCCEICYVYKSYVPCYVEVSSDTHIGSLLRKRDVTCSR